MKTLTITFLAAAVLAVAVVALPTTSGASASLSTQTPSFSVAPGGTSGFLAADILDTPAAVGIPAASLGLAGGDNINGLSYGIDYISYSSTVLFSVAPGAAGLPASAVFVEAGKVPPEPEGDEFAPTILFPAAPATVGSNAQILDEDGSSAATFGLAVGPPSDDVDALENLSTSYVDTNGDTVLERPVYFSLATGSPSLPLGIGAAPQDILTTVGAGPPAIFIPGAAMTLVAGDDIDAFCLDAATGSVIFSLTTGSPSLAGLSGASPASGANLFHYTPPGPPMLFATAANLGLVAADDVDAAKCIERVGGIADAPELDGLPAATSDSSGGSSALPFALAGAGAAAVLAVIAGGWYTRRRWLR